MRRVAAACVAAVMVVFLAACGARVDTVLEVADDGSGQRTMTLTLSTSDRDEYVTGGNAALDASIRKHLPAELSYSGLTETAGQDGAAGQVTAVFTLEFNSLKEYRTKIASLLVAGNDTRVPTVDLRIEDSLFLQGVFVEESFTSRDLLAWLEAGLIADGVVGSDASGNVTEDGDTSVRAAGHAYDSYQPIYVDEVRDVGMQSVRMRTELADDGQATRTIDYAMAADAYATNPDGFDAFLAEATPAGGTLRPGPEVDGAHTWTMTIVAPVEDIGAATSQALGGGEATFTVARDFSQEPPAMLVAVSASADCSRICSPEAADVADVLVLSDLWEPVDGLVGTVDEGSGQVAYDMRLPVDAVTFTQRMPVSSAKVTTDVYPDLTFAQTVVLTVPSSMKDVAGEDFEAMLRNGGDGTSLAVDWDDDSGVFTLTFDRGSATALSAAASRAGLSGLEISGWPAEGDGYFRTRLGAAVYDPFTDWGVDEVQSTVRGAGGLTLADGDARGRGMVVVELAGWTTAGLVTLGVIGVVVLALVLVAVLQRARLARLWRRVRADARRRATAAAAAAQAGRERIATEAGGQRMAVTGRGAPPLDGIELPDDWSEADIR